MQPSDSAEPEKARTSKATGGNTAAHVAFVGSFPHHTNSATQAYTAPDFAKCNLNKFHTVYFVVLAGCIFSPKELICDYRKAEFTKRRFEMKKYYLAYGSNLNVHQMKYRCPTAKIVGTAVIRDYELLYKGSKTGSYLTIEKRKGSLVPVAVWEVTESDECSLDIYEGCPNFYYKKNMKIRLSETGKMIDAFVYIMHEERRLGIPTPAYASTCKFGYTIFGFDFKYLDEAYEKSLKGTANNEK